MIYDEYGNLIKTIREKQIIFSLPFTFFDTTSIKPKYPRNIKVRNAYDSKKISLFNKSGLGIYRINEKYILSPLSHWGKIYKNRKFGYKTRLPDNVLLLMDVANSQWKIVGRNCIGSWVDGPVIYAKKKMPFSWNRRKNLKKQIAKKDRTLKITRKDTILRI